MNLLSYIQHRSDQRMQRRRIALDISLELEMFALRHDGHAVVTDGPAEDYLIAGASLIGRDIDGFFDDAEPGRGDKELIPFAAVDDFGIAGDDLHPALCRRRSHRIDDPA